MDIADLKVFDAVARLGGMNRAAVELNTVQSNITARIKALEADIGCLLFERRPRGVALTGAHALKRDGGFESGLLQQRVRCEPNFVRHSWKPARSSRKPAAPECAQRNSRRLR
jgi:hypothetical protein